MTKLRNAWLTIVTFLAVFIVIGVLASEISSELGQDSNDIIFTEEEIVQRQCQHEYSDWTITKESSCEEEGEKTRTCPKCNHIDIQTIRASHTAVQLPSEPATCTATGLTQGSYCSVCGKTIVSQQTVPMLPHNTVSYAGKAATCTENGWKQYEACTDCDYSTKEEIIASGSHDWFEGMVDATCGEAGYYYRDCRNCNAYEELDTIAPTGDHIWDSENSEILKYATCTEDGEARSYCSVCETAIYKVLSSPGHDWDDATCTTPKTCIVCEVTEGNALGHSYNSVVTEPTCTAQGYTTHTCSRCRNSYKDTYTDALGHTEVIDAGRSSTCILPGKTEGSHCSVCNTVIKEQEMLPLAEHNYVAVVTKPTCEASGYTTNTCSGCGTSYKDAFKVPLGHTEVIDAAVAPTCTETGLTEGSHCSVCNKVLVAQTVIDLDINAHDWDSEETVIPPTCTTEGYTIRVCNYCGIENSYNSTSAMGHSYEAIVTKPTCTAQGYTTHTCSRCGDSYKDTYTNALGHTPGEWERGTTHWIKECNTCGNVIDTEEYADLTLTEMSDGYYSVRATDINNLPSRVIIPSDRLITVIEDEAFSGANITSVILPDDIEEIGYCAFFGTNITEIVISGHVEIIEMSAFEACTSLKTVVFEPSTSKVKVTIEEGAFCDCTSLETVIFNDRVKTIEGSAFSYCESLKEIYISSTVVTMGGSVFAECYDLTVYCQAASKPSGWDEDWNENVHTVVWGYTPQ